MTARGSSWSFLSPSPSASKGSPPLSLSSSSLAVSSDDSITEPNVFKVHGGRPSAPPNKNENPVQVGNVSSAATCIRRREIPLTSSLCSVGSQQDKYRQQQRRKRKSYEEWANDLSVQKRVRRYSMKILNLSNGSALSRSITPGEKKRMISRKSSSASPVSGAVVQNLHCCASLQKQHVDPIAEETNGQGHCSSAGHDDEDCINFGDDDNENAEVAHDDQVATIASAGNNPILEEERVQTFAQSSSKNAFSQSTTKKARLSEKGKIICDADSPWYKTATLKKTPLLNITSSNYACNSKPQRRTKTYGHRERQKNCHVQPVRFSVGSACNSNLTSGDSSPGRYFALVEGILTKNIENDCHHRHFGFFQNTFVDGSCRPNAIDLFPDTGRVLECAPSPAQPGSWIAQLVRQETALPWQWAGRSVDNLQGKRLVLRPAEVTATAAEQREEGCLRLLCKERPPAGCTVARVNPSVCRRTDLKKQRSGTERSGETATDQDNSVIGCLMLVVFDGFTCTSDSQSQAKSLSRRILGRFRDVNTGVSQSSLRDGVKANATHGGIWKNLAPVPQFDDDDVRSPTNADGACDGGAATTNVGVAMVGGNFGFVDEDNYHILIATDDDTGNVVAVDVAFPPYHRLSLDSISSSSTGSSYPQVPLLTEGRLRKHTSTTSPADPLQRYFDSAGIEEGINSTQSKENSPERPLEKSAIIDRSTNVLVVEERMKKGSKVDKCKECSKPYYGHVSSDKSSSRHRTASVHEMKPCGQQPTNIESVFSEQSGKVEEVDCKALRMSVQPPTRQTNGSVGQTEKPFGELLLIEKHNVSNLPFEVMARLDKCMATPHHQQTNTLGPNENNFGEAVNPEMRIPVQKDQARQMWKSAEVKTRCGHDEQNDAAFEPVSDETFHSTTPIQMEQRAVGESIVGENASNEQSEPPWEGDSMHAGSASFHCPFGTSHFINEFASSFLESATPFFLSAGTTSEKIKDNSSSLGNKSSPPNQCDDSTSSNKGKVPVQARKPSPGSFLGNMSAQRCAASKKVTKKPPFTFGKQCPQTLSSKSVQPPGLPLITPAYETPRASNCSRKQSKDDSSADLAFKQANATDFKRQSKNLPKLNRMINETKVGTAESAGTKSNSNGAYPGSVNCGDFNRSCTNRTLFRSISKVIGRCNFKHEEDASGRVFGNSENVGTDSDKLERQQNVVNKAQMVDFNAQNKCTDSLCIRNPSFHDVLFGLEDGGDEYSVANAKVGSCKWMVPAGILAACCPIVWFFLHALAECQDSNSKTVEFGYLHLLYATVDYFWGIDFNEDVGSCRPQTIASCALSVCTIAMFLAFYTPEGGTNLF